MHYSHREFVSKGGFCFYIMERKVQFLGEIQLKYKSTVPFNQLEKISTSRDAERILRRSWDKNLINVKEQFKILYLNRANRLIAIEEHSTGGLTGTVMMEKILRHNFTLRTSRYHLTKPTFTPFMLEGLKGGSLSQSTIDFCDEAFKGKLYECLY